jgi:hypothetical protein
MHENDLKWVIEQGSDEVDYYLENVTTVQFIQDVKALLKKQADKSAIKDAIKKLEELI